MQCKEEIMTQLFVPGCGEGRQSLYGASAYDAHNL